MLIKRIKFKSTRSKTEMKYSNQVEERDSFEDRESDLLTSQSTKTIDKTKKIKSEQTAGSDTELKNGRKKEKREKYRI